MGSAARDTYVRRDSFFLERHTNNFSFSTITMSISFSGTETCTGHGDTLTRLLCAIKEKLQDATFYEKYVSIFGHVVSDFGGLTTPAVLRRQ